MTKGITIRNRVFNIRIATRETVERTVEWDDDKRSVDSNRIQNRVVEVRQFDTNPFKLRVDRAADRLGDARIEMRKALSDMFVPRDEMNLPEMPRGIPFRVSDAEIGFNLNRAFEEFTIPQDVICQLFGEGDELNIVMNGGFGGSKFTVIDGDNAVFNTETERFEDGTLEMNDRQISTLMQFFPDLEWDGRVMPTEMPLEESDSDAGGETALGAALRLAMG